MPRPKGSKNRVKPAVAAASVEEIGSRIAAVGAEIEELSEKLKQRKAVLKALVKEKASAEAAAAEKKAEEEKEKILEAVKNSGKSVQEILDFLK